jgi:hypothetical protein
MALARETLRWIGAQTGQTLRYSTTPRIARLTAYPRLRNSPPIPVRRSDSESINRGLEDTLYLNRAHSVGHARQHVNLLGYAIMVNSLALHEYRQRQRLASAA